MAVSCTAVPTACKGRTPSHAVSTYLIQRLQILVTFWRCLTHNNSHSSCDPNSATRTLLSSLICTPHFLQKHFNPKPHRHSPKTPPQPPQPSSCKNLRLIIFSYIYFILLFITSSLLSYTHFIRLSFVSSLLPRNQLCFHFLPCLVNHNRKRHI